MRNTYRIKSKWVDDEGVLAVEQYSDGSLALYFMGLDGEPIAALSMNLSHYGLKPPAGFVYVKDYSESEGLAAGMEAAGLGKCAGTVTFGPYATTATVFELAEGVL